MSKQKEQKRFALLSAAMPAAALAVFFAGAPDATASGSGCYYANLYYSDGACSQNACWWYQGSQSCSNGSWGGCGSC
jgi:hypothetical protein